MSTVPKPAAAIETHAERFALCHYTVAEVASMWNLSADAVRKIFEREAGVLVLGDSRPTILGPAFAGGNCSSCSINLILRSRS